MKKLGSHPDTPHPARSLDEALHFVMNRFVCPKCGGKGAWERDAHASLYRKTMNGRVEFFDANGVRCGSCQSLTAVFHTAYGSWWQGVAESVDEKA